mmetsp:Transcript_134688/g.430252  ORF Transcript_134688/g.430252 Transcript_134688/m.430252 type:complete len:208 (+) Transcript_134688:3499-4122(+)
MISSIMSKDLASTMIWLEFGSSETGSRNSPGIVLIVICLPALSTSPARRKKCKLLAVFSHNAFELNNIQSKGLALSAVLNSMLPSSSITLVMACIYRMICCRSFRSFAGRTVSAMVQSCMETGGSKMICENSNWKPGSMKGTLLMYSSVIEMALGPSLVGAEIRYLGSSFGEVLGSLTQQMRTSVSTSGSICLPLISCNRKIPSMVM